MRFIGFGVILSHYKLIGKRRLHTHQESCPDNRVYPPVPQNAVPITQLKRWLCALGLTAAIAGPGTIMSGCSSDEAASRRTAKIKGSVFIIGLSETHPQWPAIRDAALHYAQKRPLIDCRAQAPNTLSQQDLNATVEQAIRDKPNVICLLVNNADTALTSAQTIISTGITLITAGTRLDLPNVYAHVSIDYATAAEHLGTHLPHIADDRKAYLLLHAAAANAEQEARHARFLAAAGRHAGPRLLDQQDQSRSRYTPAQLVELMLKRFPRSRLVVTLTPDAWLERPPENLLPDHTDLITFGTSPALWPLLENGRALALVGPLDGEIGRDALDLAMQAILEIPRTSSERIVSCEMITRDTFEDFAARYEAAAGRSPDSPQP